MRLKACKIFSVLCLTVLFHPSVFALTQKELEEKVHHKIFGFTEMENYLFYSPGKEGFFIAPNELQGKKITPKFFERNPQTHSYCVSNLNGRTDIYRYWDDELKDKEEDKKQNKNLFYIYHIEHMESYLLISHEEGIDILDISEIKESLFPSHATLEYLERSNIEFPIPLTVPAFQPSNKILEFFPSHAEETVLSFLPIQTEKYFYLLKAMGKDGLVIDRWPVDKSTHEAQSLSSILRNYRRGLLSMPKRTRLQRRSRLSKTYYEIIQREPQPFLSLSKSLNAINSVILHDQTIYIATPQGIDQMAAADLIDLVENPHPELHILDFQPVPLATGIAILSSAFGNELKLISQVDPIQSTSQLNLYSEDDTLLNQWEFNSPLLGLSLGEVMLGRSTVQLFAAAGAIGIHVFEINLDESSVHPQFIHRTETIYPSELLGVLSPKTEKSPDLITGIWRFEDHIHFTAYREKSATVHTLPTNQMVSLAHTTHKNRMKGAIHPKFQLKQNTKALWNGLVAAIPFDADRLVDVIGFDLGGDLNKQLKEHHVFDSMTPEERQELEKTSSRFKLSGEFVGFGAQTAWLFHKMAAMRHLKKAKEAQHIQTIQQIRRGLGIEKIAATVTPNQRWLSLWPTEELAISAKTVTEFKSRLELFQRGELGEFFSVEALGQMIQAMEKRSVIRPLERILTSQFGYTKSLAKLEALTQARMSQFFRSLDPAHVSKFFSQEILQHWERLKKLSAMEGLSQSQKVEKIYLSMSVKEGILDALVAFPAYSMPEAYPSLQKVSKILGLKSLKEAQNLLIEVTPLSHKLGRSEEAYRLQRILDLSAKTTLQDLEKLEKLKLLLQSGWTANVRAGTQTWGEAFLRHADNRAQILSKLDDIYDFEQIERTGFISRTFRKGKLSETLLYTAYSDAANVAVEWHTRKQEGRPFISEGLTHNLIFNTYIMFPIFAIQGLRLSGKGKIFILIINAASSSYVTQKLTKYSHTLMDIQVPFDRLNIEWDRLSPSEKALFFVPPPHVPLTEMPGYIFRDMFIHQDPTFNGGWALFDSSWTLFLSTPRGIGVSYLSNYLGQLPRWDGGGISNVVKRETARIAPVFLNETVGAATYTPIYARFFEDRQMKFLLQDAKLEVIDPWQTDPWELKPKLKLTLMVHSSTIPQDTKFDLLRLSASGKTLSQEKIKLAPTLWKKIHEELYELQWEKEISYTDELTLFKIENLFLSNAPREVGDNLRPWAPKVHEPGQMIEETRPLFALAQKEDTFAQGLIKAFLALSKEASTLYRSGKPHVAAGIVYMIGQYLEPFYWEIIDSRNSHHLALDLFKESIKITRNINYSDHPIELKAIDQLKSYLEKIAIEVIPTEKISLYPFTFDPDRQYEWIHFHTQKILSSIRHELLIETKSKWLLFDEGNKNDWHTLLLYKGYSFGLSKLFRWYRFHFRDPRPSEINPKDRPSEIILKLDSLKNFGHELEASWISGLYWSDQYLVDFAKGFEELQNLLTFSKDK